MLRTVLFYFLSITVAQAAIADPVERNVLTPTGWKNAKVGMNINHLTESLLANDLFSVLGNAGNALCYRMQSKVIDSIYGFEFVGFQKPVVDRIDISSIEKDGYDGKVTFFANTVRTQEGVSIGDSVARMKAIYRRNVHYLPPRWLADSYIIVARKGTQEVGYAFVTDGKSIVGLRAGRLAALAHQGSCE